MFSFRKPTHSELKDFLRRQQELPFTYREVEGTRFNPPVGYTCGRQRIRLGEGRAAFLQAKRRLEAWEMFPEKFAELIWPSPIEAGRVVATLFRAPGFWTLNPCRIVYTFDGMVDQNGVSVEQFGFAYGTVGRHLACGEERFSVEYNHDDESVWYEVYCFSKANHWLAIAAYPYLRLQQRRFRLLSSLAMQKAVYDAIESDKTTTV